MHAVMLLVSGAAMLAWRPCRDAEGRTPRAALAMLLGGAASVWAGSLGLVVGVVTGQLGDPVAACGVLWTHLVAGGLGWWRTAVLVAWLFALPGQAVFTVVPAIVTTRRVRSRLTRLGTGLADHPHMVAVPELGTTAVTVGLLRPLIAVDTAFWSQATPLQQAIVVAHEGAHRRYHHSLVELLARGLTAPLPGTGAIYECVRRHLEALADDAAVRAHGRRPVGLALGRIALASYPAAGLGASGAAVWRVQRLVAPTPAPAWRARLLLLGTTFSLAAGLVLVAAEAASALGPVADPSFCPL
ncbi:MAG: hypothetical protein M3493_02475 [Actinomycetota bacterium]|nr:hypothetical protein [Actinomycetota bacterium]